mgnify:CR=1 FL=1
MPWGTRPVVGACGVALIAVCAHCGSEAPPPADVAPPVDAASEPPPTADAALDAGPPDAPAEAAVEAGDDAGTGFCQALSPKPRFCDDFDDGVLANGWDQLTVLTGSSAELDTSVRRSAPSAFVALTRAAGANDAAHVHMRKALAGTPTVARMEMSLHMSDTAPQTGAVAVATLDMATNHLFTLYLRDDDPTTPAPALVEIAGAARSRIVLPRVPPPGTWTRVAIEIDLGAAKARVRYDGALVVEGDISATPAALDPTFRVGVYAFGPLPALVTRFDDVVFDF